MPTLAGSVLTLLRCWGISVYLQGVDIVSFIDRVPKRREFWCHGVLYPAALMIALKLAIESACCPRFLSFSCRMLRPRPDRRSRRMADLLVADCAADSADLDFAWRIYVYGDVERLYVAAGGPDRLRSADAAHRFGHSLGGACPGHGAMMAGSVLVSRAGPFCRCPAVLRGGDHGGQPEGIREKFSPRTRLSAVD